MCPKGLKRHIEKSFSLFHKKFNADKKSMKGGAKTQPTRGCFGPKNKITKAGSQRDHT